MNSCPLQIVPTNPPAIEGEVLPFVAQKTVTLTQQEYIELKWQAAYWKSHHARAHFYDSRRYQAAFLISS